MFSEYEEVNQDIDLFEISGEGKDYLKGASYAILREVCLLLNLSMGVINHANGKDRKLFSVYQQRGAVIFYCKSTHYQCLVNKEIKPHNGIYKFCTYTKFENYIASPILVRGEVWGGISFYSDHTVKPHFLSNEHNIIDLMALTIGLLIEGTLLNHKYKCTISSLNKKNEVLESIFQNATIGMALVLPSGQWMKVNDALAHMLGYTKEHLLSISFKKITHPEDLPVDLKMLNDISSGGWGATSYQREKRYLTAKDEYIWILLSVSLVRNNSGGVKYYITQIQNIDDRKKLELRLKKQRNALYENNIRLERMATEDSLTGIANRRKFMLWFEVEITRVKNSAFPLSLAIADIDYFKSYNDDYGHQEGDIALKKIAKTLNSMLREQDKIARFGGEEFIILLPETDEHGCVRACERLRKSIELLDSLKKTMTISIGAVTYYPRLQDEVMHFEDLLKVSDEKLYEAKRAGRNQVKMTYLP